MEYISMLIGMLIIIPVVLGYLYGFIAPIVTFILLFNFNRLSKFGVMFMFSSIIMGINSYIVSFTDDTYELPLLLVILQWISLVIFTSFCILPKEKVNLYTETEA